MSHRFPLRLLAAALALGLLGATACSDDDGEEDDTEVTEPSGESSGTTGEDPDVPAYVMVNAEGRYPVEGVGVLPP